MSNCMITQSGGPTAVINAAVAGIVKANQLNPVYAHVYGALNGIEGVLREKFADLTDMGEEENLLLKQTPASALGTSRYKRRKDNTADFEKILDVMTRHDVSTLFIIGGADAMELVAGLHAFAENRGDEEHRFIGCPKTIDNDLNLTDHCPGYGSSAKYIATTALQCWYDLTVYPSTRKEVFILETMGKESGWLAASSCLSGIVDLLVVPEVPFEEEKFLNRVREVIAEKSKCLIVVSEGARRPDGSLLLAEEPETDIPAYTFTGSTGHAIERMIVRSGAAPRAKLQDLSITQRCHASEQSLTDVNESFRLGVSAHMRSLDPSFSGQMVAIRRRPEAEYDTEFTAVDAAEAACGVRCFPLEWLLPDYKGITEEALRYLSPLIQGTPEIITKNGLPAFVMPYYLRHE